VSEEFYDRVKPETREGETLGETLERLAKDHSLTDFADDATDIDVGFSVAEAANGSTSVTPPRQESQE
jgi:hypothetical protein